MGNCASTIAALPVLIHVGRAAASLLVLGRDGTDVEIEAIDDATVLLLSGQPIEEPIVVCGPFVMNTTEEIQQAVAEFNNGRFVSVVARVRDAGATP